MPDETSPDTHSARERFRQVDALFDAALDLPDEEREAFLQKAGGDDASLVAEVRQLLAAHRAAGDFLERAAQPDAAPLLRAAWDPDRNPVPMPQRIGPFRIVREVGRGGMGAVYLAERDGAEFEQRVALKVVPGLGADGSLVRRFRDERRILARLEHRHIARLVDGGVTDDGAPWFAMEFVDGERIDRYCDSRHLTVEQRLRLFESACEAVQYAHRQLVVHRDLKPSNIMVTASGELKLLDFGIAKMLAGDDAPAAGDVTHTGLAMTPQYAAPEQVRGEPVTTATDVYALGMLLYELLTGRRPYDIAQRTPAEIERIVSEVEPPRPSSAFDPAAPDRAERAAARGASADRMRRHLRGDLDAIILMALRKDALRRYPSATALLEDLRRYREGLPVLAQPESTAYRMRRFASRHRAAVAVGLTAVAVLMAGFARERSLRQVAEAEARKSSAVEEYMLGVFDVADPFAANPASGEDVTARALLERGASRVEQDLPGQPEVQSAMRSAFSRIFVNLGLFDRAEAQGRKALEQLREQYGPRHPDVAEAMSTLGNVMLRLNRFDEADTLLREALAQQRRFHGEAAPPTITTMDYLATLEQERGQPAAAESLFREVLLNRRTIAHNEKDSLDLSSALNNLAVLLFVRTKYEEADSIQQEALAIRTRLLGENHPLTAMTLQNLAQVKQLRGELDEAEVLYRRSLAAKRAALGDLHPSVTISLNNLGNFLVRDRRRPEEADSLIRLAISLDRQIFGDNHAYVAAGLNNLANVTRLKGDYPEAIRLGRQAVAIAKSVFPGPNGQTAAYLSGLGSTLLYSGDLLGAATAFRDSYEQYRAMMGESHLFTQTLAVDLARVQRDRGEYREAERLYRGALALLDSTKQSNTGLRLAAQVGLGTVLTSSGRGRDAIPLLETAADSILKLAGPDHWRTAEARLALGMALVSVNDRGRAQPLLRQAVATLEPQAKSQAKLLDLARRALDDAQRGHR